MNNSCQFYSQIVYKSDFHILKINTKFFVAYDPHLLLLKGLHWLQ